MAAMSCHDPCPCLCLCLCLCPCIIGISMHEKVILCIENVPRQKVSLPEGLVNRGLVREAKSRCTKRSFCASRKREARGCPVATGGYLEKGRLLRPRGGADRGFREKMLVTVIRRRACPPTEGAGPQARWPKRQGPQARWGMTSPNKTRTCLIAGQVCFGRSPKQTLLLQLEAFASS